MIITKLYPGGKHKALTFSFDDGHEEDNRLIDMLNKYGYKATFNLCGGICQNWDYRLKVGKQSHFDGSPALRRQYAGHEIASHTYTHQHMVGMSDDEIDFEISKDIDELEKAFDTKIHGYVSPYGEYDKRILEIAKKHGAVYHRAVDSSYDFSLPRDFMEWHPSIHFAFLTQEKGKTLLESFKTTKDELALLNIWGHSFELSKMDCYSRGEWSGITARWEFLENEVLIPLSQDTDVYYGTYYDIYKYVTAMNSVEISSTEIKNQSDIELWFEVNGKSVSVLPKSIYKI